MANIRNSISMTDRMTPTLRSILKSMDSMLVVMKNLDKASNNGMQSKAYKRAEKDLQRANNALIKMGNHTKMANNAAKDGEKAYSRMGAAVSAVGAGLERIGNSASTFLQSLASGVYLAQKLANTVSGVMTTVDTSRSQVARLGLYNTSKYSNEELYGQVFSTAMDTRSQLSDTADLVNKLMISGVYTGQGATQAAIGTAGIINKALIAGGGTSEENQRSLRQLTQGLASGVLQGDELRSIREQTPYFAKILAEGLAQVDEKFEGIGIGDLKRLGAEGELTADRVVKAMWAMQDEVNSDFEAMPKTFGQAVTSLSNIWQYFLFLLSGTDGPLGKINDMLWQFVDYLQSPKGLELLQTVAGGINFIASALSGAMQAVGDFVVYLQENSQVAQSLFVVLGAVAVTSGLATAAAWLKAVWPILLIGALVGAIAASFIKTGYTAQEVLGAIVGGVLWVVAVLWDAALLVVGIVSLIIAIVIEIVLGVVWFILFVFQVIVQAIVWIILGVWTAIEAIGLAIATIFMTLWGVIQTVLGWIENGVYTSFSAVLGMLENVASAIDAIFGTNMADTVNGWITGLDNIHATVSGFLDAGETFDSIGDMWSAFGDRTADRFSEDSDWTITDNMKNVFGAFSGAMEGVWDWTNNDFGGVIMGGMIDPNGAYNFGSGILNLLQGLDIGLPGEYDLGPSNVEVTGGDLDSVGSIKSDVSINDEDLQLLRDMAARDYLLQLQSITPVANVTFGDVRETADVGQIIDVIEQMVEEQLATSLVS